MTVAGWHPRAGAGPRATGDDALVGADSGRGIRLGHIVESVVALGALLVAIGGSVDRRCAELAARRWRRRSIRSSLPCSSRRSAPW